MAKATESPRPERRFHDSYGFNRSTAETVATASKAKADAKAPGAISDDEAALLADVARRLRVTGFDLCTFAVSTLRHTASAEQFPS